MVKDFKEELRREEIYLLSKINQKIQLLRKIRRRDFIKDTKRNCLKRNITYKPPKLNIYEFITATNQEKLPPKFEQSAKEVHSYKVALKNTQEVLTKLQEMKIKNDRPADYLVEMYKSDNQMFKVRRYLTEKEENIKERMQGKDWQSKNKKRQKSKKKVQVKKAKKKDRTTSKRNMNSKPKKIKVNGKNKIKKSLKK